MTPLKTLALLCAAALTACANTAPNATALPHYLCEQNLQFTARFIDSTVALESNQGYDLLRQKPGGKPNEFDNPRMSAEFNLGASGKEAVLRYPLLPLALRCVRTN